MQRHRLWIQVILKACLSPHLHLPQFQSCYKHRENEKARNMLPSTSEKQ